MKKSIKALKKIGTADFAGGGILTPSQRKQFFVNVVDESQFVKLFARNITMQDPVQLIDKLNIGQRVMHHAQEEIAPSDADLVNIGTSRVEIKTEEYIIIWNVSDRVAEDTIEREGTPQTIAEAIAAQAGNDMEEFALDSDTTSSDGDLNKQEGFWRLLQISPPGSNYVASSGSFTSAIGSNMIKAMPTKYRTTNKYRGLRFAVSMNQLQEYRESIAQRETMLGDDQITSSMIPLLYGIPVIGVPKLADNVAMLTFADNFIVGMHRRVTREKDRNPRKRRDEWTVTVRMGFGLEDAEAVVWTDGLTA